MQGAHAIARSFRKALTRCSNFCTNKLIGQGLQNMQRAQKSQGAQFFFIKVPNCKQFERFVIFSRHDDELSENFLTHLLQKRRSWMCLRDLS